MSRTTSTGTQMSAVGATAPAAAATVGGDSADLTDDGNARLLVAEYSARMRYVPDAGRWVTWEGTRWAWHPDDGPAIEAARDVIRRIPTDNTALKAWRLKSMRARAIGDAVRLARAAPAMRVAAAEFDRHPWQLNTPGGVVDLRTGAIAAPTPALFHSKQTTVTPDAGMKTPLWDRFLATTFQSNARVERYMQRLAGLMFIGEVREHILPFAHGAGGNGKGVFAEVLSAIAGDYATSAPQGFLVVGREKHPTELAMLQGRRLVITSEINEDTKFDEAKMKALTGGDTITARFMGKDFFDFSPSHTFLLLGNSQPKVETGGDSVWRRLRLIPFTHSVPEDERIAATDAYRAEEDHLGRFIEDRCELGGGYLVVVDTSELRKAYDAWCREQHQDALTATAFGRQLKQRFEVGDKRSNGRRFYTNIRLAVEEKPESDDPRDESWWDR